MRTVVANQYCLRCGCPGPHSGPGDCIVSLKIQNASYRSRIARLSMIVTRLRLRPNGHVYAQIDAMKAEIKRYRLLFGRAIEGYERQLEREVEKAREVVGV